MKKYHLNPVTGEPGECTASKKPCRFGEGVTHYGTAIEARAAYEENQSSFEEATPLHAQASEGLYLFNGDGQNYETAVSHLFALAEVLEYSYPDDPTWKKLKTKLKYSPSPMGALHGFDPANYDPDTALWPDHEYANDLQSGAVNKKQLIEAVNIIKAKLDDEFITDETIEHAPSYMNKLAKRDDFHGFGYLGTRMNHDKAAREEIDRIVLQYAENAGLNKEQFFQWANSKLGRWLNDSLQGSELTQETLSNAFKENGPRIIKE